jgi:hypothetical protein
MLALYVSYIKKQFKDVDKKNICSKKNSKGFKVYSQQMPRLDYPQTTTPFLIYPLFVYVFSYITPSELAHAEVVLLVK